MAGQTAVAQQHTAVERKSILTTMSNSVKSMGLPKQLMEGMWMQDVRTTATDLIYVYRVTDKVAADNVRNASQVRANLKGSFGSMFSDVQRKMFAEYGIGLTFLYTDANGKELSRVRISPDEMGAVKDMAPEEFLRNMAAGEQKSLPRKVDDNLTISHVRADGTSYVIDMETSLMYKTNIEYMIENNLEDTKKIFIGQYSPEIRQMFVRLGVTMVARFSHNGSIYRTLSISPADFERNVNIPMMMGK